VRSIRPVAPTGERGERTVVLEPPSRAEVDLAVRGPGDFFGTRQSGLPEFRVADLLRDGPLLEEARKDALAVIARDPQLLAPDHRALRAAVLARWRGKLDLASVG